MLFGASGAQPVAAGSVADFYKDKTINLYVGQSADTYARTVARHLGKHIISYDGSEAKSVACK